MKIDCITKKFTHYLLSQYSLKEEGLSFFDLKKIDRSSLTRYLIESAIEASTMSEGKLKEPFISNILAILAYSYLEEGAEIELPRKINGEWCIKKYSIAHLILTPSYLSSPMVAFGLTAQESNVPPILLYSGTPAPNLKGSLLSYLSDFTPGCGVGEYVYKHFAHNTVRAWLEKATEYSGRKVDIYGHSLGGSLALLTLAANRELINEVHSFAPGGLSFRTLKDYDSTTVENNVSIYLQKNDPTPLTGKGWHSSWNIYQIITEKPQNSLLAHLRVVPAYNSVAIVQLDPSAESKRVNRKIVNIVHAIISIPFFTLLLLLLLTKQAFQIFKVRKE